MKEILELERPVQPPNYQSDAAKLGGEGAQPHLQDFVL